MHLPFSLKNDPPADPRTQLVNAGLLAVWSFLSTVAGVGLSGLLSDLAAGLFAAGIAAALSFVGYLLATRGVQTPKVRAEA